VLRYDKRFLTHPPLDFSSVDQEAQIVDALSAAAFLRTVPRAPLEAYLIIGHSEAELWRPSLQKEQTQSPV